MFSEKHGVVKAAGDAHDAVSAGHGHASRGQAAHFQASVTVTLRRRRVALVVAVTTVVFV